MRLTKESNSNGNGILHDPVHDSMWRKHYRQCRPPQQLPRQQLLRQQQRGSRRTAAEVKEAAGDAIFPIRKSASAFINSMITS